MKYPPNALATLRGFAAGRVGWVTALGEWIDNAFDRNATHASITIEKSDLLITDDGEGTARPEIIMQLGEHLEAPNGLGEFGLGGKESLLWAGGEKSNVTITTTHRGYTRRLSENWATYAKSDWDLPEPSVRPAEPGEIGTTIHVTPLMVRPPVDMDRILEELGFLYSHAIRHGNKQITVKGPGAKTRPCVVAGWMPPEFEADPAPIRTTITVGNRRARIHAGVVRAGVPNPRSGLTYWYKYRVIIPASPRGCGNFHPARMCGFVELLDGWKASLTRNKNGLTVDDETLFVEVERAIRPILEAAARAGSMLSLRSLTSRLEAQLGQMLKGTQPDRKAKRNPGEKHGTVEPTHSGRKHQRARQTQPGVSFGNKESCSLKVGYDHLGGTKIGEAKPPTLTLNLDNQTVADKVRTADDQWLILALASLIADWDCHQADNGQGQRYLTGFEPKAFNEQIGRILADMPVLDGRQSLRVVGAE